MRYSWFFVVGMLLCTVNLAFGSQENPTSDANQDFTKSIKAGEKIPFSLKMSNLKDRISDIEPIIMIMPKSASNFVRVEINPQISTLWDGFYEIAHGTIYVDKDIPYDRVFVSVYFMGKNPHGEQVPLAERSTFNVSIKIEKSQNKEIVDDYASDHQSKEKQYSVKYNISKKDVLTLSTPTKKIPLPYDVSNSMKIRCADSDTSFRNDPRFWDAIPIRILSSTSEFQSLKGKADSIMINWYVAEELCPPNVEILGTFASENGDKHSFVLSYDDNFFMHQLDKTYSLEFQSLTPLKQYEAGIPAKYVSCKEGFQLVIKSSTGTPACLDWENGRKLLKSGWAKSAPMISNIICDSSCRIKLESQGHTCYEAAKNINFCTNKISQRISDIVIPYSASSPDGKNYIPNSITVSIGINNTVIWTNVDETPHRIVADMGEFSSPPIFPNKTWTFTFDKVGQYEYHGVPGPWLRGKVTVLPVDIEYYNGMPLENWGGEPFLGRYIFRETDSLGYVSNVSVLDNNSVMVSLSYPNGTKKVKIGFGDGFLGTCYEMNEFNNVKTIVLEEIDVEQKIAQFREELEQISKNCDELFRQ